MQQNGLLPSYRVLDLCDEKGISCGRVLGDLGADVVKVEKPGGDSSRNIGPFYHDSPDPQKSLSWFANSANKRGITLNIESVGGKEIFKKLVEKADVVLESFAPGYMANLGLGYEDLFGVNPGLVMTSVTPFGQSGPYRDFVASDLTLWCMGGMAYISGDPDRAPLQVSFPQAYLHGGAAAAAGTTTALYYREMSGEGQWVDVSIQEAVIHTLMNAPQFWDVCGIVLKRAGEFRTGLSTAANQRLIWKCRDGYVNFPIFGGIYGAQRNESFVQWMKSEGIEDEYFSNINWEEFDMADATQEQFHRFEEPLNRFFQSHTMEELYQGAIKREIMLYPVHNVGEIQDDPQLKARKFWTEVHHAELKETVRYPGSPFVFSGERPDIHRAPLIGEHNEDIFCGELGFSREELITLKQAGVI